MVGHTTAVFREDDFIGQDPQAPTWGVHFCRVARVISSAAHPFDCYTVVTVATEAEPQRYIDVAIRRYWVSREANRGWVSAAVSLSCSVEVPETAARGVQL